MPSDYRNLNHLYGDKFIHGELLGVSAAAGQSGEKIQATDEASRIFNFIQFDN